MSTLPGHVWRKEPQFQLPLGASPGASPREGMQ